MFDFSFSAGKRLREAQAEIKQAQDQLRLAETIFEQTQPVLVTDARAHIQQANKAFCDLMGYGIEEMLGQTPRMFRSDHHDQAFYDQMVATIKASGHWEGEVWDRRKSGEVFPKWMNITAVTTDSGEVVQMVACYTDLSTRHQAQQKIRQLAFYDVLTGLPNRALLYDRLRQAQEQAGRQHHWGGLILLDWDDFKSMNDTQGHPQGDALLKQIGQRISACVPDGAIVARLGGDEFAVLISVPEEQQTLVASRLESLAVRIQQSLDAPYSIDGTQYQGTASQGMVLFSGSAPDTDVLFKQAELAMYQAKRAGRGQQHFFDAALEAQIAERVQLEHALRAGITRDELTLHFQPQVALHSRGYQIIGAEVLVRWQHPEHGLLPPGLFIPLAEETGLIESLGLWVLRGACRQLSQWGAHSPFSDLTLAVNVSASQFLKPGFADQVIALLQEYGVAPERLKLELTESLLVKDTENVVAVMDTLQSQGIQFSLDDFGTGYSSLQYLKRLPLQQLKIDQSFVRDIGSDTSDINIAQAIVALANGLGLLVIAEGVETQEQQMALEALGCKVYQGYRFSRPLPLADFETRFMAGFTLD
jgi:diguanylate cyclase (GGDEF)-like protein/PAS domain S-box-containing protein